ncbi:hypothetical protein T09_11027, partial [Trichinella sp. T9]
LLLLAHTIPRCHRHQITSMTTVEREKSAEHVEADETRNSERPDSTKEVRCEVRSFERGVAVAIKHDIMVNPRSCAISNYSDYWIFEKNGKIAFDMYPVLICMCNNVVPVPHRKAMSIEEMEEHFKRRSSKHFTERNGGVDSSMGNSSRREQFDRIRNSREGT